MLTISLKQITPDFLNAVDKLEQTNQKMVLMEIRGKKFVLLKHEDFSEYLLRDTEKPKALPLEEKRTLTQKLCGSWAGDESLKPIFDEIEIRRHTGIPREVKFDEAS